MLRSSIKIGADSQPVPYYPAFMDLKAYERKALYDVLTFWRKRGTFSDPAKNAEFEEIGRRALDRFRATPHYRGMRPIMLGLWMKAYPSSFNRSNIRGPTSSTH